MIKRCIFLSAVVLAFGGILLASMASPGHRPDVDTRLTARSDALPQVLAVSYRALDTSGNELTPEMKSKAKIALGQSLSTKKVRGRRISTPLGVAWIIVADPSRQGTTCLIVERSGASTCAPTKVAARVGLAVGTEQAGPHRDRAPHFSLLGIAPNWVKAIKVKELGYAVHLLSVRHNVYATYGAAPVLIEGYCGHSHTSCVHLPLPHQRH